MTNQQRLVRRGFSPEFQADEIALQRLLNTLTRAGTIPLDDVIARLDAQNLPPQLVQASWVATIPTVGTAGAQLLIPKNRVRKSFLIGNPNANGILFSYDAPLSVTLAGVAGSGAGIPILSNSAFSESNGSISINDLWVFSNQPVAAGVYPMFVLGYEGELAITGNPPPPNYRGGA